MQDEPDFIPAATLSCSCCPTAVSDQEPQSLPFDRRFVPPRSDQRRGRYLPGTLTYGWDAQETGEVTAKGTRLKRVTDNPAEQTQLIRMVQWRAAGLTWYANAKRLNRDGIKTKNKCRAWCGCTESKLLCSRPVADWLSQETCESEHPGGRPAP